MASDPKVDGQQGETFAEFKNSFSYGARSNMLFKFLKGLGEPEASEFFEGLLAKMRDTVDDGNAERLISHVYEWQVQGYAPKPDAEPRWRYEDGPFTPLRTPLSRARVALVASSGHFVEGDDPAPFGIEGMTQEEAERRINDFLRAKPQVSRIPMDTLPERTCVRHGGYDITGARKDRNTQLPVDRLRELEDEGIIREAVSPAYSFVGAAAQLRVQKETSPELAETLRSKRVDAALLVAA
ncbi:MAG: glycine/sarcosine/betaine reductase selenoprotein B family protein [Chloroflexota bacterium]